MSVKRIEPILWGLVLWSLLLAPPVRAESRIAQIADQAWTMRQSVRSQLFEKLEELPEAAAEEEVEVPLERHKKGFFQRASFAGSWLGTGDRGDMDIASWDTSASFAVPLSSFENFVLVTPSFRTDYLDGPVGIDVPGALYETGVSLMWRKTINERWGLMTMASPMVRSDFESTKDIIYVSGLAIGSWEYKPNEVRLLFGAVYLNRGDIPLLPAVGLQWTPSPWWQLDLTFPRPRLAHRILKDGSSSEIWAYTAGALGGSSWSVERSDGTTDELSLRDYRLMWGVERIMAGGSGLFAELGYVFGRELEYESTRGDFEFNDAAMFRAGYIF